MLTDNLVIYKIKSYLIFFVQMLAFTKSLLLYQQVSITRYILHVTTSLTYQWVQVIPGQIIMFKQVNSCVLH